MVRKILHDHIYDTQAYDLMSPVAIQFVLKLDGNIDGLKIWVVEWVPTPCEIENMISKSYTVNLSERRSCVQHTPRFKLKF